MAVQGALAKQMRLTELRVRYRCAADAREHEALMSGDGTILGDGGRLLGLTLETQEASGVRDTQMQCIWKLTATPQAQIMIVSIQASLEMPLSTSEALYLNGYNSWTDSVERRPDDAMRSFGVPRAVIDHWVLDGSGDYRFTEQDERRGHQHGFEYAYLRRGTDVLFVGALGPDGGLGCDSGFTTIYEDLETSRFLLDKEPPATSLVAGESRPLMAFMAVEGTLDGTVEAWLAQAGIRARRARPLVGYSSWYRHYGAISQELLLHDLDGVAAAFADRDTRGCETVFQIDDGYARIGDWMAPDSDRFPEGLAPLACKIRDAGLVPGLWIAPFVCERKSRLFIEHPDWLLHDAAGHLVKTGSHWSGQVALDTEQPEVRQYVTDVIATIVGHWGFFLLKCDFLYGACMLPHAGKNRGQLMASALDLIREAAGPACLIDCCGVPLASAFGRADYCRVGCDVGLSWDSGWLMARTGRERVSTARSLANTLGRAHLDGRAFRIDPDVFFLRRDVRMSEEQKEKLLRSDAALGGMLLTSDDMGAWDARQQASFDEALTTFRTRAGQE